MSWCNIYPYASKSFGRWKVLAIGIYLTLPVTLPVKAIGNSNGKNIPFFMVLFAIFVGLIRMSMKFRDAILGVKEEMKSNAGLKAIAIWSVVSFLMVAAIKTSRGQYFHLSPMFSFMQGTLPNFFAATGITSWAFMYYRIFPFSISKLLPRILLASLFAFAGLTLWEIIQYFMGYAMDINDIAMTAVGCILTSVFIYLALKLTQKK